MAATRMTRAEAEALLPQVRNETTLTQVEVVKVGQRFAVAGNEDGGQPVTFHSADEFAGYPGRDPQLPAKRRAEAELRYRQRDLDHQGQNIRAEGEQLVKLLRRVADYVEQAVARTDAALVVPADKTPTARQIASTRAHYHEVLARQIAEELDWINPARINRTLGDRRVDLATAKATLLALLPADGDDD